MRHNFHFDKSTGTMVPESAAVEQALNAGIRDDVREAQVTADIKKPVFDMEKKIDVKGDVAPFQVVDMKRVGKRTPVRLVDENGTPESYLDSTTTGVMMFREMEDYDICQIADDKTGKVMAYIGGYALQINFNMAELNTLEKIEQCLQGLVKLFRHKIMTQTLNGNGASK